MRDDDGDLQLAELLDSSFGAGPDGLPAPAGSAQSRDARPCAGATGPASPPQPVAVVAVLGLGAAALRSPGRRDRTPMARCPPLATSGTTATPSATATPLDAERQAALDRLEKKARQAGAPPSSSSTSAPCSRRRSAPDGQVVVKDGWRIAQRVDEPMGLPATRGLARRGRDRRRPRRAGCCSRSPENQADGQGNPARRGHGPTASRRRPRRGLQPVRGLAGQHGRAATAWTLPTPPLAHRRRRRPAARRVRAPPWWRVRPAPVVDRYTTRRRPPGRGAA